MICQFESARRLFVPPEMGSTPFCLEEENKEETKRIEELKRKQREREEALREKRRRAREEAAKAQEQRRVAGDGR